MYMEMNGEKLAIVGFAIIGMLVGIWVADNMTGTTMQIQISHNIVGNIETDVFEWVPRSSGYIMGLRCIFGFVGVLCALPILCVFAWMFDKL